MKQVTQDSPMTPMSAADSVYETADEGSEADESEGFSTPMTFHTPAPTRTPIFYRSGFGLDRIAENSEHEHEQLEEGQYRTPYAQTPAVAAFMGVDMDDGEEEDSEAGEAGDVVVGDRDSTPHHGWRTTVGIAYPRLSPFRSSPGAGTPFEARGKESSPLVRSTLGAETQTGNSGAVPASVGEETAEAVLVETCKDEETEEDTPTPEDVPADRRTSSTTATSSTLAASSSRQDLTPPETVIEAPVEAEVVHDESTVHEPDSSLLLPQKGKTAKVSEETTRWTSPFTDKRNTEDMVSFAPSSQIEPSTEKFDLVVRSSPSAEMLITPASSQPTTAPELIEVMRATNRTDEALALEALVEQASKDPGSRGMLEALLRGGVPTGRMERDWEGYVQQTTSLRLIEQAGEKANDNDMSIDDAEPEEQSGGALVESSGLENPPAEEMIRAVASSKQGSKRSQDAHRRKNKGSRGLGRQKKQVELRKLMRIYGRPVDEQELLYRIRQGRVKKQQQKNAQMGSFR